MPSDAVVEGVSGAIGGCVATVATYPLMKVSTLQATRVKLRNQPASREAQPEGQQGQGTIHELTQVVRTSGWQALFSGLSASLIGTTVSQGIYFYLYSTLRQLAVSRRAQRHGKAVTGDSRSSEVTVAESLLMAALAGMGNVLLTNPIWMVATRMQTHNRHNTPSPLPSPNTNPSSTSKESEVGIDIDVEAECTLPPRQHNPVSMAREVFAEYGVKGFWNGVGPSLVMVINPTIQYALYEWLSASKAVRARRVKGARPSALEVFMVSAVAKAGATVLTYPLLTIKTRMMTARKTDAHMQYTSVLDAVLTIARKEGMRGYYRGIRTKIVQSVLAAALLFMCKEKITDKTREILMAKQVLATISKA